MSIRSYIRSRLARRLQVPQIPFALERLAAIGYRPSQIFDIGAYKGEFALECLRLWPNTKIACFEALEEKVEYLQKISHLHNAIQVFPGLMGEERKEDVLFHETETASSVLTEHFPQNFPTKAYPMTTVDEVVRNHFNGRSPSMLKLDVQGYELAILKGAEQTLAGVEVILAETNLLDIHRDVPLLGEVMSWLNERDWVAYDICGLTRRPLDKTLWQADFIFTPRDSPLRADKRWAS
jgi:FkbM family methyltransferase